MNINEIIDKLDIEALRKILKDECEENYKLRKLILNIESDNEVIENKRLFDSYRYIDTIVEELEGFNYNLDQFDSSCASLAYILKDLEEDVKNRKYSYATKVGCYMLSELSYCLNLYDDGLCYPVDDTIELLKRIYHITKDNSILSTLMDSIDNDYGRHLKDIILLDCLDNDNCKFILEYLEELDAKPSRELLDRLLGFNSITVDDKLRAYSQFDNLESFIRSLELLYNEKDYKRFDSIYFSNKDRYEGLLKGSSLVKDYYLAIYNRYVGYDDKRALGSLLSLLEGDFNENAYLKAVELASEDEIEEYFRAKENYEVQIAIEFYKRNYDLTMNLITSLGSISLYDKYLASLGKMYKDRYQSFYKSHIFKLLASAKGREDYKAIAEVAKKLILIEIDRCDAIELYREIKLKYPRKRSLLEEFSFLVSYVNE